MNEFITFEDIRSIIIDIKIGAITGLDEVLKRLEELEYERIDDNPPE